MKRFRLREAIDEVREAQDRVRQVFTQDIAGALEGAPWPRFLNDPLEQVLVSEMAEDHLPAFRDALRRDPRLIAVVEKKGWGSRFGGYVQERLAHRNPMELDGLVRVAGELEDPSLGDDLRWQFVYGRRIVKAELYPVLEHLLGREAASAALSEAWYRSRGDRSRGGFLGLALDHGLPGAMEFAVSQLYLKGKGDEERSSGLVQNLRKVTGFTGDPDAFYTWVTANVTDFRFDEASRRWLLADERAGR